MRPIRVSILSIAIVAITTTFASATIKEDLGVAALQKELGDHAPNGAGVPVTIVESASVTSAKYTGKQIVYPDGSLPLEGNAHANTVGANFFGSTRFTNPMGTGITDIEAFRTGPWQSTKFLYQNGSFGQPRVSGNASRIANHSYQYLETDDFTGDRLRRMDWLVATDDFLQIVGTTGSGAAMPLGMGFNTISIAPASGGGPRLGTAELSPPSKSIPDAPTDSVYTAGRFKPDLVGPTDASGACGWTSGIAAMLIQTAHQNPGLSRGRSQISPRTKATIYDGETSEVIKAALMAGALRNFKDNNPYDSPEVRDYREGMISTVSNDPDAMTPRPATRPTTRPATSPTTRSAANAPTTKPATNAAMSDTPATRPVDPAITRAETPPPITGSTTREANQNAPATRPDAPTTRVAATKPAAMVRAATDNGLDRRYGAGQVNAFNSYHILAGGEADSAEDGGGAIGETGFDYDDHFGGANGSNAVATYTFKPTRDGKFIASLVWNVKIDGGTPAQFAGQATLHHLFLTLVDVSAGKFAVIAMRSASTIDNTQNIWTDVIANHEYQLIVTTSDVAFDWDYGLAWRMEAGR